MIAIRRAWALPSNRLVSAYTALGIPPEGSLVVLTTLAELTSTHRKGESRQEQ